jgi:hypothetical protein
MSALAHTNIKEAYEKSHPYRCTCVYWRGADTMTSNIRRRYWQSQSFQIRDKDYTWNAFCDPTTAVKIMPGMLCAAHAELTLEPVQKLAETKPYSHAAPSQL